MKNSHKRDSSRILIGFGESLAAPEVAWCLLGAGFYVSAFTRWESCPSIRKCREIELLGVGSPETNVQRSVDDLIKYWDTKRFAAIMPLDDVSLWVCNQASRSRNMTIVGATQICADFALNKKLQLEKASKAGFSVPPTKFFNTIEKADELDNFPMILKPAEAVNLQLGKLDKSKFYICANCEELKTGIESWERNTPLLAQSLISGTGEGIFGFAVEGGVKEWSAHRRIRMMNPSGSGSSACMSIAVDERLKEVSERLVTDVGWRGMFMIELLRDKSGKAWFMEFNGRPWGSIALSRRMGFEYPVWACRQVFDATFVPPKVPHHPAVVCRHLGREILHILMVIRGPKSKALTEWPSTWKTLCDVLHFKLSDCWYNWQPGCTKVFWDDTYQTLRNAVLPRVKSS